MKTQETAARTRDLDPEHWVEEHGDCLYRYALLRVRRPDVAAEIVQETFLAALRSRHNFAGQSSERTWLVGILKHKLIDHLRQNRRPEVESTSTQSPDAMDDLFNSRGLWKGKMQRWRGDPAEVLQFREFRQVLEGCLGKLPRNLAEAIFMRELDGKNAEEVCTALAISPTNLWARLHRARLLLRRCLEIKWFGSRRESA